VPKIHLPLFNQGVWVPGTGFSGKGLFERQEDFLKDRNGGKCPTLQVYFFLS
jgi:hypothetical protein